MDRINKEVAVVEFEVVEFFEQQLRELNDLHLALVGGGVGETIL